MDSFTQYTKTWVEKVNRGGLTLVNDGVYEVFSILRTSTTTVLVPSLYNRK